MGENFLKLQLSIDRMLRRKNAISVLEAGCGSASHLYFGREVHLVGIDVSEKQLQRNTALNERILGDIQYYDFPPLSFDIIVCWDVLEHLSKPELALQRFARWVKDEGIVILKAPNVFSMKGLLVKYLPYRLHILIYKYFWKETTGKDDTGPFRTYLRFTMAPGAVKAFAVNNDLKVVCFDTYDVLNANWLKEKKAMHGLYCFIRSLGRILSLGKLRDSDYAVVLRKE